MDRRCFVDLLEQRTSYVMGRSPAFLSILILLATLCLGYFAFANDTFRSPLVHVGMERNDAHEIGEERLSQ